MYLIIAAIGFAIYCTNVVMGALLRAPFLSDVGEMLVLFAASIAFTAAILRREADAKAKSKTE
ncbi:hypothetical protein [Litorisediminicola beolgyonensis]|uniref:Uncharacterized protein n=1 Tax=Litorisediminicola beolgyonensis TaxID=1173614 RepID=A0ABW3ZMR0_9RHOB